MRLIQLTLGAAATQITPNTNTTSTMPIYVSTLIIQNNAAAAIRIGDNTVTATKGIALNPSAVGPELVTFQMVRGSLLSQWYIFGTAGNIIDIMYETAQ
jgi:hypothetical protein